VALFASADMAKEHRRGGGTAWNIRCSDSQSTTDRSRDGGVVTKCLGLDRKGEHIHRRGDEHDAHLSMSW
jgi:hypothetical protein